MPHVPFTSSDSWVLLAITYASSQHPAELSELVGWGDALNHALLTPQEVRRGVARLRSAGYIEHADGLFSIAPAGRQLLDRANAEAGDAPTTLERWRALDRLLGATSGATNAPDFEDPDWPYPAISDAIFASAVAAYEAEFARLLPAALAHSATLSTPAATKPRGVRRLAALLKRSRTPS